MQVLLLIFSIPFALSPLWTHQLFQSAFEWEREQIAVDNAGIKLGQLDRDLFNWLVKANRMLRAMELVHHPLHPCWTGTGVSSIVEPVASATGCGCGP